MESKKRTERVKGLRSSKNAEESNNISMDMVLQDELIVGEIISRLPMKLALQCKLVCKSFNTLISHPKFSQTLLQREIDCSTQLIYTSNAISKRFYKISFPIIHRETVLPDYVELLASCKGLILFDFDEISVFCVFNPVTGARQLIPYPVPTTVSLIGDPGLAVDYSSSDQYKLVCITTVAEDPDLFYKFHVLSSEQPGLWREILLRTNTFCDFTFCSPPVYWRDSLHWLRKDGSVLAFDTKREQAILLDRPEFIDQFEKVLIGHDIWLGVAQGLLTLVCIFKKSILIAAYDEEMCNWRVAHTLDNLVSGPHGIIIGFPVLIDSERVLFLVERPLIYHDLYKYDTEIGGYTRDAELRGGVNYPMYSFQPTLASVHESPLELVNTHHLAYISEKLDQIRRFIMEGIPNQEEEEEEESSSSSEGDGEVGEGEGEGEGEEEEE